MFSSSNQNNNSNNENGNNNIFLWIIIVASLCVLTMALLIIFMFLFLSKKDSVKYDETMLEVETVTATSPVISSVAETTAPPEEFEVVVSQSYKVSVATYVIVMTEYRPSNKPTVTTVKKPATTKPKNTAKTTKTTTTTAFSSYLVNVKDYVPIYEGPGYDYPIAEYITELTKYTIVDERSKSSGLWGKLKSGAGWINIDDAKIPAATEPPTTEEPSQGYIININNYYPIYEGPGYDYPVAEYITELTGYTIVEESRVSYNKYGLWGKLKSGAGWINIDDVNESVKTESEFSSYIINITDYVPIYEGPGYDYPVAEYITELTGYTIVDERSLSNSEYDKWDKLKSGAGWINLADATNY